MTPELAILSLLSLLFQDFFVARSPQLGKLIACSTIKFNLTNITAVAVCISALLRTKPEVGYRNGFNSKTVTFQDNGAKFLSHPVEATTELRRFCISNLNFNSKISASSHRCHFFNAAERISMCGGDGGVNMKFLYSKITGSHTVHQI